MQKSLSNHSNGAGKKEGGRWRCTSYARTKSLVKPIILILLCLMQLHICVNHLDLDMFAMVTTTEDKRATDNAGKGNDLIFTNDQLEKICNVTNAIVHKTHEESLQSQEESMHWKQTLPFFLLTCQELTRSLHTSTSTIHTISSSSTALERNEDAIITSSPKDNESLPALTMLDNNLSFQRLAQKLQTLQYDFIDTNSHHQRPLKIIVIGGSMTTGLVDIGRNDTLNPRNIAWPRKLELFMHQKWGNQSVQIINLAEGGADENTWIARMDVIMSYAPFDIVLVESAVNDQCDAKDQISKAKEVDSSSHILLKTLMKFPHDPAVISVELFRLAYTDLRDARRHCPGAEQQVKDGTASNQICTYCPQWWKPQEWRKKARERNSVAYASYKDAVWPELDHPPERLCQYWSGLSHPQAGTHALVASTLLFQFMAVLEKQDALVELANDTDNRIILEDVETSVNVCLKPISSFRALLEDPNDPMQLEAHAQMQNRSSCWTFRADVRQKYGWICEESKNSTTALNYDVTNANINNSVEPEQDYLHLRKELQIGGDGKVIISRLVSYDERMAVVQVWFSHTVKYPNGTKTEENVFAGSPVWKVTSWSRQQISIPQPETLLLMGYTFTEASKKSWKSHGDITNKSKAGNSTIVLVTFNMKLILGSSPASKKGDDTKSVDKFKLLGVVTC